MRKGRRKIREGSARERRSEKKMAKKKKKNKRKKVRRSTIKKLQRIFTGYSKARAKEKKWFKQLKKTIMGNEEE